MNQAITMNNANVSRTNSSLTTLDSNQKTLNTKVNEMAATLHQLNAALSRMGMGNTMPTYPPVVYPAPQYPGSPSYVPQVPPAPPILMFLKLVQLDVEDVAKAEVDEVEEVRSKASLTVRGSTKCRTALEIINVSKISVVDTNFVLPPKLDSTASSSNYYHALHAEEEDENEYDDDVTVVTLNTSCNKGYCSTGTYTTEEDTDDDWTTDDDSTSEEESTKSDNKIQRNSEKNNNVTHQQAWNSIIQVNNLQDLPAANIIFDNQRVVKQVEIEYALSDSGASGHFLVEGAPVTRKRVAKNPISIVLPDGSTVQSTHTCHLDIPWLPDNMTEAHIVPQLAHSSLISTRKFYEAGCKVVFDIDECRVYYNNELVLVGRRDRRSRL